MITRSPAYLNAKEDKGLKLSGLIVPAGYKYIGARDVATYTAIASANGLKSGTYVSFTFEKLISPAWKRTVSHAK